jgi:hypothetical protein
MRRFAFIAVLAAALGLTVPGAALAKSHHNARSHHSRSHRRGHARTLRLTPASVNSSDSSTTDNGSSATPASDSIGTVGTFDGTTLTLNLNDGSNDGSTVSGKVNRSTEIECVAAPSSAQTASTRDHGGSGESGDSGSGDGNSSSQSSTTTSSTEAGDDNGQNDQAQENEQSEPAQDNEQNEQGDDNGTGADQNQGQQNCGTSALTPGTRVRSAELRISSSDGSVFRKIVLFV